MSWMLDSGTTLLWLGISVAAFVWLAAAESRAVSRPCARLRRILALVIVSLALFAPVSDVDDLFSYSLLGGRLGQHGDSFGFGGAPTEDPQDKAGLQLVQLLASLEHCEQAGGYAPAPALFCLQTLIHPPARNLHSRGCLPPRARSAHRLEPDFGASLATRRPDPAFDATGGVNYSSWRFIEVQSLLFLTGHQVGQTIVFCGLSGAPGVGRRQKPIVCPTRWRAWISYRVCMGFGGRM